MKQYLLKLVPFLALIGAILPGAVLADKTLVLNSLVGVQGYDLVSYHSGKPLPGNGNHLAEYKGVTYLFINEENQNTFEKNPANYIPAFGGYCAFGVTVNRKFFGDPQVWFIRKGTLYLNLDANTQNTWRENIPGNIKKANSKWKEIKDISPYDL